LRGHEVRSEESNKGREDFPKGGAGRHSLTRKTQEFLVTKEREKCSNRTKRVILIGGGGVSHQAEGGDEVFILHLDNPR